MQGGLFDVTPAMWHEAFAVHVHALCICPGIIRTRFHEQMTPEQKKHNLDHRVPLHREGTPEQVATLIAEVATNDYVTGETFTIDGGLTMRIA